MSDGEVPVEAVDENPDQSKPVEIEIPENEPAEPAKFEEGALLGDEDYEGDSRTSSELGSEEIEDEEEFGEETRRRRKHKKSKKHRHEEGSEEEEEIDDEEYYRAMGEEKSGDGKRKADGEDQDEEEREDEDEDEARPRVESVKKVEVKPIISGFDLDMGDDVGEEEVSESTESEPTPLIREPYYARYLQNMKTYAAARRLNNFLHKKMAEYFKKRKMEHVLREMAEHLEEAKMKYGLKLNNFQELISRDKNQRATVNADLKIMKQMCYAQVTNAETAFNSFVHLERDTGIGLINSKTGKEIPDKVVDKLLHNQKSKAKEIKNLRLKHIKIRNAVADKHAAIRALDRIGENYTLIEFEQMKIENSAHVDKIEEKDDELSKLRKRCSGAIQCLAHVREKCSAVEMNIRLMKSKLEEKDYERIEARETMNELKQKRDYFRREAQRLKEVNGLLTKDKLLIDMEDSMKENEMIVVEIADRTKIYNKKKEKLDILKENYEKERKRKANRGSDASVRKSKSITKTKDGPNLKRGRPTIMMPTIPDIEY